MCKVLIFSIAAVMLVTAAYGATVSPEKVELLDFLIKDVGQLEASKDKIHLELYTPDEKEKCTRETLQCYLAEISIVKKVTARENADTLRNIMENLWKLTNLTAPDTGCKNCEACDSKSFPEFHEALLNFLRYLRK